MDLNTAVGKNAQRRRQQKVIKVGGTRPANPPGAPKVMSSEPYPWWLPRTLPYIRAFRDGLLPTPKQVESELQYSNSDLIQQRVEEIDELRRRRYQGTC
jgi:hypothetical protein